MYPPQTVALRSTQVRALEARAYESVPAGSLMQKVAMAIAVRAAGELREHRGLVVGGRVVLLVGTGDNGGDALFAGAHLARRGARVDALLTGDRAHPEGRIAFERAGGKCHQANVEFRVARDLMFEADVIIDGIVGIGGSGALREPAAKLAALTHAVDSIVIAVDLPSGVDCDSGHIPHPRQTVMADLTITSGCLKPALVVMPAAQFSGDIEVVDIGLELTSLDDDELLIRIDDRLAAQWLDRPHELGWHCQWITEVSGCCRPLNGWGARWHCRLRSLCRAGCPERYGPIPRCGVCRFDCGRWSGSVLGRWFWPGHGWNRADRGGSRSEL